MNNFLYKSTARGKKKIVPLLCTIFILVGGLLGFNPFDNYDGEVSFSQTKPPETSLTVQFLDVGQGNCVLAESNGRYILIDGGDREHSSFVVSYLQQMGISELDYVIISHYDSDHLNGIVGVMHQFEIGNIIAPNYEADTKIYNSYKTLLSERSYTPIHPNVGDSFYFGDSAFQIVSPAKYTYSEENNNSIGIRLTDSYQSFLILGDAQSDSENDILKSYTALDSDVYMVSHHGSSGSSSEKFLNQINPKYAVISVGVENDYGHPTKKVLDRLNAIGSTVFRTDENGTVTAYSGKHGLTWRLEKE